MSLLQVNTAVPLMEPLLEQRPDQERGEREKTNFQSAGNRAKFAVVGAITGFFIQVVSLGAYAFILVQYRGFPTRTSEYALQTDVAVLTESGLFRTPTLLASATDSGNAEDIIVGNKTILYPLLSVLTQIDLIAYVLIWVAFTCTMTNNGMACIRAQFFSQTQNGGDNLDEDCESLDKKHKQKRNNKGTIKQRDIFVLGVYFLVGIVLGAFGAWSAIDLYLGFPIPFKPIITTVTIDLLLCYLMVWCYDLGGKKRRRLDEANNSTTDDEFLTYDSEEEDDGDDCEPATCC
uniref:Uncharacterized protein n=1 Tax=Pseudo-nitzschia australis TaxID=44445 RepID=A0A7S4AAL2_9STRA|mmetsp:Transcript_19817/g.42997  ORF Transcript_19817/g.42997 Transcript_19817/m.42997 type:complete len:290 (+) Transcript_19817:295-1164(+)|eukprot:CAMPEP_0168191944 /NCGR_PEP_ID=MMETSP0139_2-20121125/17786_1 /TAXON_ID=44445 /ORGANISM="Pseudo-nitzschia australis, Strain 10249 10 AB" /LENGTH=289 /DNA_ID=CAMNT_0008115153 /DNA_START=233 /DNA_END=1102 /DNA_ORIENTATION=+